MIQGPYSDTYLSSLPAATAPRVWAVGWVGYVRMINHPAIQQEVATDSCLHVDLRLYVTWQYTSGFGKSIFGL
jgi:hypothetical protein